MNQFYNVEKLRPVHFSANHIVICLSQLPDGYLIHNGVDLEKLNGNMGLEKEDMKLVDTPLSKENISGISKRRQEIYACRMGGSYIENGKSHEIYTNKEIKDIARKIWCKRE